MNVESSNGGVGRLGHDLLWTIFMKNAQLDVFSHNRLKIARYSSQVCRQWRITLLQSSSIWGRLMNLDELRRTSEQWKEAIASRTGDASIWIHGSIGVEMRPYFTSFLDAKWHQVQILDVSDYDYNPQRSRTFAFLMKKAPNLKILKISISEDVRAPEKGWLKLTTRFFDNHAPVLEVLVLHGIVCKLTPNTSWLSNLRTLSLDHNHSTSTIFALLNALPLLEHLRIPYLRIEESVYAQEEEPELPMINLPHLTSLWLNGSRFFDLLPFLERITPSKGCGLYIGPPELRTEASEEQRQKMLEATKQHMIAYFQRYPPTTLSCVTHGRHIRLQDYRDSDASPVMFPSACFSVWHILEPNDPSSIEGWTSSNWISGIQKLELDIRKVSTPVYTPSLLTFFSAMESVTTLLTNEDTLRFLLGHRESFKSPVFPKLKTLTLLELNCYQYPSVIRGSAYVQFLIQRAKTLAPIQVLDLSHLPTSELHDMEFLATEDFSGMIVRWRLDLRDGKSLIREHSCGTSPPSDLHFKKVWNEHLRSLSNANRVRRTLRPMFNS